MTESAVEEDFQTLAEPYRRELLAYCYRMLGSVHDAEDLVQETLLRAWQARGGFEGRASLRSGFTGSPRMLACCAGASRAAAVAVGLGGRPRIREPVHVGTWDLPGSSRLRTPGCRARRPGSGGHRASRESIRLASSPRCSTCRQAAGGVDHAGRAGLFARTRRPSSSDHDGRGQQHLAARPGADQPAGPRPRTRSPSR